MPKSSKPVVSMTRLGRMGRFGNQIFQYAFLRIYAFRYNLHVETSEWVGQYLFGHRDGCGKKLPAFHEKKITDRENIFNRPKPFVTNVDLRGYFQYHTKIYAPYKKYFCSLFQPVPDLKKIMSEAYGRLLSKGKTIVGLHIRRGDYVKYQHDSVYGKLYYIPPKEWYIAWLQSLWETLDDPILFIASDELDAVLPDYKLFKPITSKDLLLKGLPQADYYLDHYILSHCDILGISNSTFSFTASMLNQTGRLFCRPDLKAAGLVTYDPWNSPVNLWNHLVGL